MSVYSAIYTIIRQTPLFVYLYSFTIQAHSSFSDAYISLIEYPISLICHPCLTVSRSSDCPFSADTVLVRKRYSCLSSFPNTFLQECPPAIVGDVGARFLEQALSSLKHASRFRTVLLANHGCHPVALACPRVEGSCVCRRILSRRAETVVPCWW